MKLEQFADLMKLRVRELGGDGRTVDEILADLVLDDPWFSTRQREIRIVLRDVYQVPETRT